jgi:succinate-semialdehyde dehydrogenase/glutarate-semialdehyde dehydrogenase
VTGSSAAGTSVAAAAGRHAKKTVLELGGSDAFIVMPSADIAAAAAVGVESRTLNNGQSCIGAKRFIVHTDVYDNFVELFAARLMALTVGDPMQDETDVGPLAMQRSRERLNDQVERLLAAGARRIGGAASLPGPGFYFQPGMLESVPRGTDVYYEELFGPVALMFRAADLDDAIEIANDSRHGLGASIWTAARAEADAAVARLDTGATFVNALVKSDPVLPFGGVRGSGYGRELARDGILEFVNRKAVYFG